jgi:hypothetical protein
VRGIEPSLLAWIGLALMLAAATALLLHLTRGTTLWFDEWDWALYRRGHSAGTFLEPHNGHFSLVPITLYKLLFATAGLDHYLPYRLLVITGHFGCVVLVFVYAARRVGALAALIPAALLLTLGPAWQNFLWPFQIGWLVSLAAGVGALLLLDRTDRLGDVGASVLLAIALASSGLGIPIAGGLLIDVAWGRRSWRAAWIVAAPIVLYAMWWLVYQDSEIVRSNVFKVPAFAAGGFAGALASLGGLSEVRINPYGLIEEVGATLPWGRPLAVAAAGGIAWRLATLRPIPPRVFTLMAIPLAFWMLTGLQRAELTSADASRYLYVGAVFLLLLAADLLRGVAVTRPVAAVAVAVTLGVVLSNLGDLRTGARFLRGQAPHTRADLGALELARANIPPGYEAKHFPGAPFITVRADAYFAAAEAHGTPAYTPDELAAAPESARSIADAELTAIHDVGVRPAAGTSGDDCVRVRSGDTRQLTVPPEGLLLKAVGGPARVSVRRFAGTFQLQPLAELSGSGLLRIDPDRAPQPWHVQLVPTRSAEACSVA